MTKDELFEKIKSSSVSDEEYLINLLKFRGFLIDAGEQGYVLSDNGHIKDAAYLDELLRRYDIGQVDADKILVTHADNAELLFNEFKVKEQIKVCVCGRGLGWSYFKRRTFGLKAAVSWLEPYIARYVKAISACGVITMGSCDGNHPGRDSMFLQLENAGSVPWHKVICEKCLVGRFNIKWRKDYCEIRFGTKTQFETYYGVNRAAEFLYNNRIAIREIKRLALSDMTNSYFKKHTDDEIKAEFIERAERLFDESDLCVH